MTQNYQVSHKTKKEGTDQESIQSVILLPANPASFTRNCVSWMQLFLFQRVPGCNSIADLSLK